MLMFQSYDFTAGSQLRSSLSFHNTGDTMIRYSKGYPIKAELLAVKPGGAGTVTINEWEIAQNILPGQKIELSGAGGVPLAETLPMGTTFQLRVSENAGYFTDNAFSGLTDSLLTVEELPELAFDSFAVKTLNILENGDTQVQLDFSVSNRGTTAANGTYVQLAYQDGEESYSPLDLTGAKFNISNQQPLGRAMDLSLKNGVLRLQSTQENGDGDNISPNNGRTVSGVFTIPRGAYYKGDTGNSFNLRAEVFDADAAIIGMDAGYYTATHKEYVSANNATNVALEQSTIFQLPNQIAMALGNTMQLPARIRTSSQTPAITVTEVPQGEDWVPNLGILYYNEAAQRIVIVPAQEGSGIIRVADAATNSYFDIAYKVDGVGVGINIYNDNAMFTFYGADGTPYTAEQAVPSWQFKESLQYGNDNTTPYRNDLSIANEVGSYFTFDTQAEKISLYFTGTVEISSDLPGFAPKQITSLTGAVPVEVSFGDNSDLRTHTVKVKAVMADAKFDRYVENFGAAAIPLPAKDKEAPQMYWSRSFPDTASILVGASAVELVCYLLDNGTIQSVTVNGEVPKNLTKTTDGFWQFPLSISKNGEFSILATDTANNRTGYVLNVDWFAKVVSSGASAAAPNLSNVAFVDGKGTAITAPVGNGNKVRLTYTTDPLLRAEKAQYFNLQTVRFNDLTAEQNGDYLVNNNGVYRVLVVDENNKWRAEIRHMGWLDAEKPTVTLAQTTENGKQFLSYSVTKPKNSAAALSTVTINGVSVGTVSGYQSIGKLPLLYSGSYTLEAADEAGNLNSILITATSVAVDATQQGAVTMQDSWNQSRNNGSIVIDPSKLTGGSYVAAASGYPQQYQGSYEFALAPIPEKGAIDYAKLTWGTTAQFQDLLPGDYALLLRDAQQPDELTAQSQLNLQLGDRAVTYQSQQTRASIAGVADGSIQITAMGGRNSTQQYQFALLPLKNSSETLTALDTISESLWQEADAQNPANQKLFDALTSGYYQLAVREKGLDYSKTENYANAVTQRIYLAAVDSGDDSEDDATFAWRYLEDERTGIVVYGSRIHREAQLKVTSQNVLHQTGCAVCAKIRAQQSAGGALALYELSLTKPFEEKVTVGIPVNGHEGETLAVVICDNGTMKVANAVVTNGKVWVRTDSLSIVALFSSVYGIANPNTGRLTMDGMDITLEDTPDATPAPGEMTRDPQLSLPDAPAEKANWIWVWMVLALLGGAALVVWRRKKHQ